MSVQFVCHCIVTLSKTNNVPPMLLHVLPCYFGISMEIFLIVREKILVKPGDIQ